MPRSDLHEDRILVEAVIAGDAAAIEQFVRRYSRVVHWIARRDTRLGAQDADDVTQRVFIRLLEDGAHRLCDWYGNEAFEPYLRQVARNDAISFARENISPGHDPIDSEDLPALAASGIDAEDAAQLAQIRESLVDCYDGLAPAEQRALVFRYRDELDQRTIGAMLGISPSNAAQRVSRATRRLRDCLSSKLGARPWVLA